MTRLRLDVISDVVCPWCWLGKRRLDAAIAAVPELDVSVTWRAFQLDPDVPQGGVPYPDYMKRKFGDLSRIKDGQARLTEMGRASGIVYRFDEIPNRPNTLFAHCLIRWAQAEGKGSETVEALFKAHFDELRDVGDRSVLADIASEVGQDRARAAEMLASGRELKEVGAEEEAVRRLGVRAAPTFIGAGRAALQGAHETEAMVRFIRAAAALPDARRA